MPNKFALWFIPLFLAGSAAWVAADQSFESTYPYRSGALLSESRPLHGRPLTRRYFPVYLDMKSGLNHYFPTGFMGDHSDVFVNGACKAQPHNGRTCIKIVYRNPATQGARWVGMYWQNPAYNWGNLPGGGYNLTGMRKLIFWARGQNGGERIESFSVGGMTGRYGDSLSARTGAVVLTREWKRYEIPLTGEDLRRVSAGFGWTALLKRNPGGATFYLDDIYFV